MNSSPEDIRTANAFCTLYRDAPQWGQHKTAAVGRFHCDTAIAGAELLASACARLGQEGFAAVIGPMNGDTWHNYRLVSQSDGSRPFLLEPVSGAHDGMAFAAAGFAPVSNYVSTRTTLALAIGAGDPVVRGGITVRPWDGRNAEGLVSTLFDLSTASFSRNAFFKPIQKTEFLELYQPVLPMIDPRLVFFAHKPDGTLAGFLFGLPDQLAGPGTRTVILKTYASRERGTGHILADAFHRAALSIGFQHVIHALIHDSNVSLERSQQHSARVFRRYALMGRLVAS